MADQTPNAPDGWGALLAAAASGIAITQLWRPLGGWFARRLDLASKVRNDELSDCRKEIKALRVEFGEYQTRTAGIITELSIQLARVETALKEREADVAELRRQLRRPRQS